MRTPREEGDRCGGQHCEPAETMKSYLKTLLLMFLSPLTIWGLPAIPQALLPIVYHFIQAITDPKGFFAEIYVLQASGPIGYRAAVIQPIPGGTGPLPCDEVRLRVA